MRWAQRAAIAAAGIGIAAALALICSAGPARAAPPPPDSLQYEMLHPYAEYLSHWTQTGAERQYTMRCCDISDCRAVDIRTRDGHYQARIMRAEFGPGAPDDWVEVPDSVVDGTPDPHRPPFPVACWSDTRLRWDNGFYCFSAGAGY